MVVARRRLVQKSRANVASLPAPVGGWNARDSLANMAPTDAVILENYFPSVSNVNLRGGYVQHATGLPDDVETLISYSGSTTDELFAVSDGDIYDVTAAGPVGAPAVTGLTSSQWEYTNITTAGGSFLYAANGVDKPLLYDGSTWTPIDGSSSPAVTGVTTTELNHPTLFKNRMWFVQKDTLKAWYLPTSSVGGAAQAFDLSTIARLGGYLVSMASWTIDAGYGADDNLVFITNNGEVIVYRGTDPASTSTWALIGVWIVGAPIGERCLMKYGGDLLVLTLDGLVPLASALQSSRLDPNVALSDKIQGAFASAAATYGNNFGWCLLYNPKNNALIVNVPVRAGGQEQFVMNNITKAWCKFTGWYAYHFALLNDELYWGGSGFVAKGWVTGSTGYTDDTNNIFGRCLQAFNYFETRGVKKIFTRARPSIFTNGTPSITVGVNVDFNIADNVAPLSFTPPIVGVWDSGLWDSAIWGSDLEVQNNWQGVTGVGFCGAIQLQSSSNKLAIQWASTDVVFQLGWAGI